MTFIKQCIIHF